MKITDVNNLSEFLYGSKIIGKGTTAICFLTNDNRVLKLYRNTYLKKELFEIKDMYEHLQLLNKISNGSFIGPEEILMKDNNCIGYIYNYIDAKTLSKVDDKLDVLNMCKNFKELLNDVKKVSDYSFRLADIHNKNILFNSKFYIIDLDKGYIDEDMGIEEITRRNKKDITKTIIYNVFNVSPDEEISFYDKILNDLYYSTIYYNQENLQIFFERIIDSYKLDNVSIKKLNLIKNSLIKITPNYYYKY